MLARDCAEAGGAGSWIWSSHYEKRFQRQTNDSWIAHSDSIVARHEQAERRIVRGFLHEQPKTERVSQGIDHAAVFEFERDALLAECDDEIHL